MSGIEKQTAYKIFVSFCKKYTNKLKSKSPEYPEKSEYSRELPPESIMTTELFVRIYEDCLAAERKDIERGNKLLNELIENERKIKKNKL